MLKGEKAIQIHINRLGWHFAFIGVFAMMGGAIRGYNLPLVLAGMLVGLMLMHWRLGRSTVESVSVKRRIPDEAFAGEPFKVRFLVCNHSRWLAAWLIQIDDRISHVAKLDDAQSPWRLLGVRRTIASRRELTIRPGEWLTTASCGVGTVAVGMTGLAEYDCLISRRGKYVLGPVTLSSAMPLGLITLRKRVDEIQVLNVYPRLQPLRRDWRQRVQSRNGGSATTSRKSGAADGDFFGLRSWQSGDSKRWIHWRTTARIGEPAVRQFEQQRRFDVCILVDAYLPTKPNRATNNHLSSVDAFEPESPELELVISTAASLISQIMPTPTNRVAVAIAESEPAIAASGGGSDQLRAMMTLLSEIRGSQTPKVLDAVDRLFRTVGKPQDLVVLSPRLIPPDIERLQALVSNQCTLRWFSAADGSLDRLIDRGSQRNPTPIAKQDWVVSGR